MNEEWRNEIVTKGAAADAARDVYKRNTTAAISAMMAIKGLPSAQPQLDEWCDDCKEYDQQNHSCPRFNRVIHETLDDVKRDAYKHGKSKGIKKGLAMVQPQWIPFSEQSPKDGQKILACSDDGIMWMTVYSPQSRLSGAWMPLPEPYEE